MKTKSKVKLIGGQFYSLNMGYWCVETRLQFIVTGKKAKPVSRFLSEVDLLTLPVRNIRARQRQTITSLHVGSWQNLSTGKGYNKAIIDFHWIYAN